MATSDGVDLGSGMVGGIANIVHQGILDITTVVEDFYAGLAADACQAFMAHQQTVEDYQDTLTGYIAAAAEGAAAITWAQQTALRTWGTSGQVTGADSFLQVLWDAGARPPDIQDVTDAAGVLAFLLGPLAALLASGISRAQWEDRLQQALPSTGAPPANGHTPIPGTNAGVELAPGIWLWAGPGRTVRQHLDSGLISGWRAREMYWAWVHATEETVGPADWLNWADDQAALTGSAHWQPGDPIGGQLGAYQDQVALVVELYQQLREQCAVQRTQQVAINKQAAMAAYGAAGTGGLTPPPPAGDSGGTTWLLLLGAAVILKRKKR